MDDVSLLTHGINASNSNGITTNTDWQQIIREYEAEYGQEAESIDAMMPEYVRRGTFLGRKPSNSSQTCRAACSRMRHRFVQSVTLRHGNPKYYQNTSTELYAAIS